MKKISTKRMVLMALGTVVNLIGGLMGLTFQLPLYLDAVGSIFMGVVYGPLYAGLTAFMTGIINGTLFDVFSYYFMPSTALAAICAGFVFKNKPLKFSKRTFLDVLIFTLPGTILASITAAYLFGGQTSAGSSLIVQVLNKLGFGMTASVFVVQIMTEYADRLFSLLLIFALVKKIPPEILED